MFRLHGCWMVDSQLSRKTREKFENILNEQSQLKDESHMLVQTFHRRATTQYLERRGTSHALSAGLQTQKHPLREDIPDVGAAQSHLSRSLFNDIPLPSSTTQPRETDGWCPGYRCQSDVTVSLAARFVLSNHLVMIGYFQRCSCGCTPPLLGNFQTFLRKVFLLGWKKL